MQGILLTGAVIRTLLELDWSSEDGAAVASKGYQTAVGTKRAHAYLEDYGSAADNLVLKGEYQSEGRNILEPRSVLIPKTAGIDLVVQLVKQFAADVDATVASSYAARLSHKVISGNREIARTITARRDSTPSGA